MLTDAVLVVPSRGAPTLGGLLALRLTLPLTCSWSQPIPGARLALTRLTKNVVPSAQVTVLLCRTPVGPFGGVSPLSTGETRATGPLTVPPPEAARPDVR